MDISHDVSHQLFREGCVLIGRQLYHNIYAKSKRTVLMYHGRLERITKNYHKVPAMSIL